MPEDTEKLEETALSWPAQASEVSIVDQESYNEAAILITRIVTTRKQVVEHHRPIKETTNKAHKEACAAEKRLLLPLSTAELIIGNALLKWDREQKILRDAEQKRLQDVQRKVEEEARLEVAALAESEGAPEEVVEAILETPVAAPTTVMAAPTYTKAPGLSTRMLYSAEVTNIRVLCAAVAAGTAAETLVQPNDVALNGLARCMKDSFRVPGCKLVKKDTLVKKVSANSMDSSFS